jgi:hypothetical protein
MTRNRSAVRVQALSEKSARRRSSLHKLKAVNGDLLHVLKLQCQASNRILRSESLRLPPYARAYAATDGRTLVIPRQYVATIYEISVDHQAAVCDGLQVRTRLIDRTEAGRLQYRRE